MQRRLRDLPSRVGVYFLLAMCLFPEVGYRLVWDEPAAGLDGVSVAGPTPKALRDLRRRLGAAPVRALFEVLAGPLARPTTPGVRFGPFRTVSFDGCSSQKVADSERNRVWLGRTSHHGYPTTELMTLAKTGTRALIGAVFGPPPGGVPPIHRSRSGRCGNRRTRWMTSANQVTGRQRSRGQLAPRQPAVDGEIQLATHSVLTSASRVEQDALVATSAKNGARSRQTTSTVGRFASQAARLDDSRSGSRSTGRRLSTSTRTVP